MEQFNIEDGLSFIFSMLGLNLLNTHKLILLKAICMTYATPVIGLWREMSTRANPSCYNLIFVQDNFTILWYSKSYLCNMYNMYIHFIDNVNISPFQYSVRSPSKNRQAGYYSPRTRHTGPNSTFENGTH